MLVCQRIIMNAVKTKQLNLFIVNRVTDYEDGPLEQQRETEQSAELSEDTDCDGSSLPEDSPEVQIKPSALNKNMESMWWLYLTFFLLRFVVILS